MRNRSAFTLIELLVVVAIISILMAVLLPSLSKARESAVTLKCLSSLRAYGAANLMYANESAGCYVPIANSLVSSSTPGSRWYNNTLFRASLSLNELDPATMSLSYSMPRSLMCPKSYGILNTTPTNNLFYVGNSYGMNYLGLSSSASVRLYKVSQVVAPHMRMMVADALDWQLTILNGNNGESKYIDPPSYGEQLVDNSQPSGGSAQMLAYRHGERTNMVFFDGHAETMKFSYVKSKRSEIYGVMGP